MRATVGLSVALAACCLVVLAAQTPPGAGVPVRRGSARGRRVGGGRPGEARSPISRRPSSLSTMDGSHAAW